MLTVCLNNQPQTLNGPQPLSDFLAQQTELEQPFAVAINGEFVPRSQYAEVTLQDGDALDVVSPVGGG